MAQKGLKSWLKVLFVRTGLKLLELKCFYGFLVHTVGFETTSKANGAQYWDSLRCGNTMTGYEFGIQSI